MTEDFLLNAVTKFWFSVKNFVAGVFVRKTACHGFEGEAKGI